MNDGREPHGGEIAHRDFQGASGQSQFCRSPRNRLETSAVGCGVTKLSNPWHTYLASEIPANHPQARCAAVHLVDLHDRIDLADTLAAFAKQSGVILERKFLLMRLAGRLLAIKRNLVVHLRFGRKQLGREIKRNTRFGFRLIKRKPLAQQFIEFRKPAAQVANCRGLQRQQFAISKGLHRRRARRAV